MGSVGIGCTVNTNISSRAKKSKKSKILFNGDSINFPTVNYAIGKLVKQPVEVDIKSVLPLGCGFGISGAATLATIFAVNRLMELKMTKLHLSQIAHTSEIVNKTGLGTVTTQVTGGFLIKKSAGFPIKIQKLPFSGDTLFATIIGPLPTPSILTDKKLLKRINKSADKALLTIEQDKNPTLNKIIDLSFKFASECGLLKTFKVKSLINKIKNSGGHATMAMLGQVIISNIHPKNKNYKTVKLKISNKGIFL